MGGTYVLAAAATVVALAVFGLVPAAHAEQAVEVVMEQTTYSYCEKLFYTIRVSEVTGEPAIIHIRDSVGKGSSAIPIPIAGHETPVPSRMAFNEDVFPLLGSYFIDVEYAGEKVTAEFALVDSGKKCLPELLKPVIANWVGGLVSDGIVISAFEEYVDKEIIEIPFQVTEQNMGDVRIPPWVKFIAAWWIAGDVSDDGFAGALQYLLEEGVIKTRSQGGI